MNKIYIRLKDKTSTYWLAEQGVSLVGEIPKRVEKSGFVSKLLKNGVAETISDEFAEKYLLAGEEKKEAIHGEKKANELSKQVRIITDKIKDGKFDLAGQIIAKAEKEFGDSAVEVLETVKTQLKEAVDEADNELEEKKEIMAVITSAIDLKIIIKDQNGYSIDGKVVAETEEAIIGYLLKSKKSRTAIEKKIDDIEKEKVKSQANGQGKGDAKNPDADKKE